MSGPAPRRVPFADLSLRLASGLALAAVALLDIWAGGIWAAAFVTGLLLVMLWEFHRMVTGDPRLMAPALVAMAATGAAAVAATAGLGLAAGLAGLGVGGALTITLGRYWSDWLAAGLAYMGLAMCALIAIRAREPDGVYIILWLVVVVIAADVGAYFAGRSIGGRRLAPRISPGKTWAGAAGGLAAAALAGLAVALAVGWRPLELLALSIGVAVASQLGDLLESLVKRRFGAKDASRLIPGHGGVMDRLDGLLGAVWFFALAEALGLGGLSG